MPLKWCPGHQKFHSADAFGSNSNAPDGLATYCKVYANEIQREWRAKNSGKVQAIKREYIARVKRRNMLLRAKGKLP
jgi:hypothetical protein